MKFTFLIILTTIFVDALAQNVILTGQVIIISSNNKPLAGSRIISRGANPTVTTSDGVFKLNYHYRQPGDKVTINVTYQDYKVINERELSLNLTNSNQDTLKIYVCSKVRLDALRSE